MTVRHDPTEIKTVCINGNVPKKGAIYIGNVVPKWPYLDGNVWKLTADSALAGRHTINLGTFNLLKNGTILENFIVRTPEGYTLRIDSVAGTPLPACIGVPDGNNDATTKVEDG